MKRPLTLNYHEVHPEVSGYLYQLATERFADHLKVLAAQPEGWGEITFDDGHRSQFESALPLLQKSGLRATFFITAGWTGQRETHMGWSELAELVSQGHQVQAHSWSHRFLTHCSPQDLARELELPKKTLEDRLGRPVDALSLPGGRGSQAVYQAAWQAGYRRIYTSDPWMGVRGEAGGTLHGRVVVTRAMDEASLRGMLERETHLRWSLRAKREVKETAKRMLGDANYHRLWRLLSRHTASSSGTDEDYIELDM